MQNVFTFLKSTLLKTLNMTHLRVC